MHTEPHIYNSEYETVTEKCYLPKSTLKQALMFCWRLPVLVGINCDQCGRLVPGRE